MDYETSRNNKGADGFMQEVAGEFVMMSAISKRGPFVMKNPVLLLKAAMWLYLVSATTSAQVEGQRLFTAGGELKVAVPSTPEMITALQKDRAFKQIFGGQTPPEGSFLVSPAQLRESKARDFIVVGRMGLPIVASGQVPFWLLLQDGTSFSAIHNFLGQELEIKSTWTAGFADLELRAPSPRGDKFIVSLKYDSATQKYKTGLPVIRDEDIPALLRGQRPQNP
jgi:hypothetical protein